MRVLVAAFAALLATALWSETADASNRVQFGIQDDAWLEHGPGTLSSRVAELDRLGLDVVRVTLNWHQIETAPESFRWTRADRLLRALRARNLDPVVTLWGTPGWANGGAGPNVAPLRDEFGRFAGAAAARYQFVRHWLLWNEPNKPTWLKPASPETYVRRILNPGYRAIKAVSPSSKIAGGVTAPRGGPGGISPVDFIRRIDAARARLDAYAHHPYPVYPGATPFTGGCVCETITMADLERLVRLVGRAFPRARIWLTEYAYQTTPPDSFGVSYERQARYIGESARRVYAAPKVDMLIHYLYRDEPNLERWQSGLMTVDGRPKPALAAMALPLAQIGRRGPRIVVWGQVRPNEGRQRYVLQMRDGDRWVAVGRARLTDARGYFVRSIPAPRGAVLRILYPGARLSSDVRIV